MDVKSNEDLSHEERERLGREVRACPQLALAHLHKCIKKKKYIYIYIHIYIFLVLFADVFTRLETEIERYIIYTYETWCAKVVTLVVPTDNCYRLRSQQRAPSVKSLPWQRQGKGASHARVLTMRGSKKEVRQLGHQLLGLLATSASVSVATRPPGSQPQLGRVCSQITRGQQQQTERPA